ncbi:MAG: hypothetical protein IPO64_05720 [Bacteroidetes bacterium]|nr:hypothetical protein [Bacteroidota bacterium]
MKKITFVLFLLISSTSFGQGLIVKAGVNLATTTTKIGGEKVDVDGDKKFSTWNAYWNDLPNYG